MRLATIFKTVNSTGWTREPVCASIALAAGFGLMPAAIFYAGSQALGRYEGASVARIYQGIYQGLPAGSLASWIVVLGPLAFYLIFKGLRQWWRASARLARGIAAPGESKRPAPGANTSSFGHGGR